MADPANTGDKYHSHRSNLRNLLSIMSGAAGHNFGAESELLCRVINEFLKTFVGQCWMTQHRIGEAEASAIQRANLLCLRANAGEHLPDLFLIQVAQLESHHRLARNNVVCSGLHSDPANCPNLASGNAGDHLIHLLDESGRGEQSIMALIHRRCAGMIGEAFNRDIGVQNPDNSFHHSNVDLFLLQISTLLDMQLEISGYAARLALYLREPAQVTADELNAFSYALAALAFDVQQLVVKSVANDVAADGASFFVLKDDYLQRVAQLRAALIQDLSNFNGRKRSNIAIVIATFRH